MSYRPRINRSVPEYILCGLILTWVVVRNMAITAEYMT